jgi:hypothetical protein
MNEPTPPTRLPGSGWLRKITITLMAAGVVGYVIYLANLIAPYAVGSDSSGYLNNARLLSEGKFYTSPRLLAGQSPTQFGEMSNVPLGFTLRKDGHMAPTYPTGYPLQLAAIAVFSDWNHAAIYLNALTALASGWLLYAFSRKLGLNAGIALGGVALLWCCPLFLFSTFQPMSDLSALCWTLAALYWALIARERWQFGILSGLALGIAILVRPTNVLLTPSILVAMGIRPRQWLATALSAFPAVAFFCYYNWRVYGSPWVTGYGSVASSFSTGFLPHNLAHFLHWIPILLSPVVVIALAAPFTPSGKQRGFAALVTWVATLGGFYTFYYNSGETWWYLRFILPAFPALIVALLAVFEAGWRSAKFPRRVTAVVIGALLLFGVGWEKRQIVPLDVLNLKGNERSYPDAAQWAKKNLPANSVIFCMQVSGAFLYYTDFLLLRWDQILPVNYGPLMQSVARDNRPVYAALFGFEMPDAFDRIGGHWIKLSTVGQVTFWQRQP